MSSTRVPSCSRIRCPPRKGSCFTHNTPLDHFRLSGKFPNLQDGVSLLNLSSSHLSVSSSISMISLQQQEALFCKSIIECCTKIYKGLLSAVLCGYVIRLAISNGQPFWLGAYERCFCSDLRQGADNVLVEQIVSHVILGYILFESEVSNMPKAPSYQFLQLSFGTSAHCRNEIWQKYCKLRLLSSNDSK